MKKIVVAIFLTLIAYSVLAQTREENIRRLIEISKADQLGIQVLDMIMPTFQKALPQVPTELWEKLRSKIDANSLVESVIPIYSNHYTNEEILELIEFYQTPLGQKVISESSAILSESMAVGQEWGKRIANQIIQELISLGYSI